MNLLCRCRQIWVLAFMVIANPLASAELEPVISIGSNRELFVDRYLINQLNNCRLQRHEPRDEGQVIPLDKPWEGPHSSYSTVILDGDLYRMYYRGVSEPGPDGNENERTCYAESRDGIHWIKPTLGIHEFNGSRENNLILDQAAPITHNFSPFLDTRPGVPAEERYKGVGGTGHELFGLMSADGLHWKKIQEKPLLTSAEVIIPHTHLFDSQNLAFWSPSEGCYVCYFRVWDGVRRIAKTTSLDFRSWTPAVLMRQLHDDGSGPRPAPVEHIYTNQTSPYFRAPQISVAIAARFFEGRQVLTEEQASALQVSGDYFKDTSDAVLMTTRGGDVYDRTFLEGYIKPGIGPRNWVSRTNYPALNVVPTGPHEMSLYVNQDYAQPTAHLRRYSLRIDGFASLRADALAGELITKPFTFSGNEITINFATSAAGGLRIELQDITGKPIQGFALADCREQIGNEVDRVVTWNTESKLTSLASHPIRLRIVMQDADLFSFQFRPSTARQ